MNKYPFKLTGANINRKLFAVGSPALDITQTASKAVSGVTYNFRGAWSATLNCALGDTVLYGTTMWLATAASTGVAPGNGLAQWQSLGSYSAFQGTWSATSSYVIGDEVVYSGNFWLALAANTNSAPTTSNANWQIAGPISLDNVADGTTYTRTLSSVQTGNVPDLSKGILNKNLTYVADGTAQLSIGTGDGTTTVFALPAGWRSGAAVYKSDWQGNQLQYSTPRTNYSLRSEDFSSTTYRSMTAGVTTAAATSIVPGGATLEYTWSGGYYINSDISGVTGISELTFSSIVEIITSLDTYIAIYDETASANVVQIMLVPSTGVVTATIGSPTFTVAKMGAGPNGGTLFRLSISVSGLNIAHTYNGFWSQNSASSIVFHAEQTEVGLTSTSFIQTTTAPVTVTDYSLGATQITFAPAPANAAALTALVGRSAVANGPGLQGVLAVDPYSRALIDTAQSGHLNQWQYQYMASQVQGAVGSTADVNGNYILGFSTSQGTDDAGWGNTAVFGDVSLTPTTLGGYGITNGQPALGNAAGEQILYQNSGGNPFWGNKYGTEFNSASTGAQSNVTGITSTTKVQIGNSLRIANPNQQISIFGFVSAFTYQTAGSAGAAIQYTIEISTDGGSTFTTGNLVNQTSTGLNVYVPCYASLFIPNVTPTGDVVIKLMASVSAGTWAVGQPNLCSFILPESNFAIIGPALSVVVPGTQTANCIATYPAASCAALSSITAVPSGGSPAYSFSWSRTGGTGAGTIVSGATSATVNVSCTETGTTGGASFTDTYKCIVTDSLSNTANASCTVTSTFTLVYSPIVPSLSVNNAACANNISGNPCTATGSFTASATGGNGNYTFSNSIYSYDSGFTTNPTIVTGATSATGTYSGAAPTASGGNKKKVTLQTTINDTRGTGAESTTNFGHLTFNFI